MDFRPHTHADHAAIAELRWQFKAPGSWESGAEAKREFIGSYEDHLRACDREGRTVHWLIDDDGALRGVMTVRVVPKEPSPSQTTGSWGYLTNCFVVPEARNRGLGTQLLGAVKCWATDAGLELLIVWPSEDSYRFYRRAGFAGRDDPLVLLLNPDEG